MRNLTIPFGLLLILVFMACEETEKNTINADEAQTLLTEAVTAYSIYAKTQEEATKAAWDAESSLKSGSISANVYPQLTVEPFNLTEWPKTITIDYGQENYLGLDGRYRRGVLLINASNFAHIENAIWDISFDDFYQNDHKVEGTQSIKYLGTNTSNNPEYECSIKDGKVTNPAGKVFYFEQHTTREWINGYDTHYVLSGEVDDFCDDEYLISGTHNGVSSDGFEYNMETTEPLHVNVCCKWVMDGNLTIGLPNNNIDCEINYRPENDAGEMCNAIASFSIFGITYPIVME